MRSRLIRIAAAVAMFELGLFVAGYLVYWIVARPGDLDFGSQYGAAYVAVHHGWSHLYDLQPLHEFEAANHLDGLAPFQHPPPDAWLAVPFLLLPLRWAALVWQALLLAALIAAAFVVSPARRWDRTLTVLKPQLTLLVAPILLAAGYRKTAVTAVVVMAAMALASVAVIGLSGTRDYIAFLTSPDALNHPMPWTVKGLVGAGTLSFAATAVVVVAAIAIAVRLRPPPDVTLAVGILASLFVAQHLNVGDFVLWLLPVWLAFRGGRPWWLRAVAVLTWMTGWLVVGTPIVSALCDVALAVAFVVATVQARPTRQRQPISATSSG